MRKKIRKFIGIILTLSLIFSMNAMIYATTESSQKEEIIYAILEDSGDVNSVYVVNAFDMTSPGSIIDFGNYESIKNLTTTDTVTNNNGMINVNVPAGRFYYQGNMGKTPLPWEIKIGYKLNNIEINAKDLIGQSGMVEISIQIKKNLNISRDFFEKFALQISLSLDGDKFTNIFANEATIANAGNDKNITFTHLPGNEKSYIINADVKGFELNPIQFTGVVLSMNVDLGDMDSMTGEFTKLTDGLKDLYNGVSKLEVGSSEFNEGINKISQSTGELTLSSNQINSAISDSAAGLNQIVTSSAQLKMLARNLLTSSDPQVQALANGFLAQQNALDQMTGQFSLLASQYSLFDSGINQLTSGISLLANNYTQLNAGISEVSNGIEEMSNGTDGLDKKVSDKITEMTSKFSNEDYIPVSFVSENNSKINSVQFIIRTNAIEIDTTTELENSVEKELNFWEKLLQLFGLNKEE